MGNMEYMMWLWIFLFKFGNQLTLFVDLNLLMYIVNPPCFLHCLYPGISHQRLSRGIMMWCQTQKITSGKRGGGGAIFYTFG